VKVSAKRAEFADFLQKRLTEGGLTAPEATAASLLVRIRGWNRKKSKQKQKTQRKTQFHVGDSVEQNGATFTVAEVRFGKVIAVKDPDGVIHRKEQP
jgi:hypothetical protein